MTKIYKLVLWVQTALDNHEVIIKNIFRFLILITLMDISGHLLKLNEARYSSADRINDINNTLEQGLSDIKTSVDNISNQ